jgi:hypothetical protein
MTDCILRVRVTLWLAVYRQSVLATSPLRPMSIIFIFQLNTCGCSPYVTSSLMREWVCCSQLLLGLASAVILKSKPRGTHNHILLSQIQDPQPGGPGPHIYIPQEYGGPVIPPGTGFPFCCLVRLAGLRWKYLTLPPHIIQLLTLFWSKWCLA